MINPPRGTSSPCRSFFRAFLPLVQLLLFLKLTVTTPLEAKIFPAERIGADTIRRAPAPVRFWAVVYRFRHCSSFRAQKKRPEERRITAGLSAALRFPPHFQHFNSKTLRFERKTTRVHSEETRVRYYQEGGGGICTHRER